VPFLVWIKLVHASAQGDSFADLRFVSALWP